MGEIVLGENDAGQRADRFLAKAFPDLPKPLLAKLLRTKKIKRNGARLSGSDRLEKGDVLTFYVAGDFLKPAEAGQVSPHVPALSGIVYEDENLLFVNKPQGLVVHGGESGGADTLIARIHGYLAAKNEWRPENEHSFAPALCNRIDRNTGGLVIAAKNAEALRDMNEIIKTRQVDKYYLCLVHGNPAPPTGILRHYLLRNEKTKEVSLFSAPTPGAKPAETAYAVLENRGAFSLVECLLLTGRTHQIRAQMASAGWPLAGDAKYGIPSETGRFGQALWAYKLDFSKLTGGKSLAYLQGKIFLVPKEERGAVFSRL